MQMVSHKLASNAKPCTGLLNFAHLPIRQLRKMLVGATSPNPFEQQLRCWLSSPVIFG